MGRAPLRQTRRNAHLAGGSRSHSLPIYYTLVLVRCVLKQGLLVFLTHNEYPIFFFLLSLFLHGKLLSFDPPSPRLNSPQAAKKSLDACLHLNPPTRRKKVQENLRRQKFKQQKKGRRGGREILLQKGIFHRRFFLRRNVARDFGWNEERAFEALYGKNPPLISVAAATAVAAAALW